MGKFLILYFDRSEERLIEIAPKNAACMWTPEATYDKTTGEYVVYWATGIKNGNGKKIYYAKTRDFWTFTEPQIYKDVENGTTFIDTIMIEYDGMFYRFTNNENEITIFLETSDAVLGDFSLVKTRIADESYVIPEWQCYSSRDMKEWTYEGVILSCKDIPWADNNSAWAAQTVKHYSAADGKDMYYFYFCSWDNTSEGKQSIGVAVSDSPTGPFKDIGHPLVKGTVTTNESSGWNDIDPTMWIETDDNGEEHRYFGWENGKYYICELNEDMVSVKDLDGDGAITFGKDILEKTPPESYTEAPWFYRRQDENGKYYGDYYLFYAYGWREQMAYATTDDLINGEWKFGGILMEPSATSDTNHMSVIDFQGKTYFIYHNGSLEKGSGYRRVACVEEFSIQEDGRIEYIPETAAGPFGTTTVIKSKSGQAISHKAFSNSSENSNYPYLSLDIGLGLSEEEADGLWVLVPGKADTKNENYVSIVSYNKPGLYITGLNKLVKLSQNAHGNLVDAQTFKTVKGLSGDGISFESVAEPGMYITATSSSVMKLTDGSEKDACTFYLENQ